MKIAFFGTSEFAVPILEALAASEWRPSIVVTTPDAPAGRGSELRASPIQAAAKRLDITLIQPSSLSPIPAPLSAPYDLFLVAAYGKILPVELLKIPTRGCLNMHPSILPRWRGPSPIQAAILQGDAETGVTIMLMDEKVDHGPIVRDSRFKIQDLRIATPELTMELARLGAALLLETIPDWLAGKIIPAVQDETLATFSTMIKKEDGRIDWSLTSGEIERMVRAFQSWPGTYTFWQGARNQIRLEIERADSGDDGADSGKRIADSPHAIGYVMRRGNELAVQTQDGILLITHLKPAGGKSMSAADFLRGHPDVIGTILS